MTSTERAPEPTMEEILASIRRIISDDEQNQAKKPAAAAVQPQTQHQDDEGLELELVEEADDQIINDIARVLSGGANSQAAPAPAPIEAAMEEEDDILDLTAELGGLEPVEETMEAEIVDMVELVAEAPEEAPAPEVIAEEASAPEVFQPAPARPQVVEAVTPPPPPLPEPAPAAFAPPPMSASDEAASALERAIAALKAGQLPTSFTEFTSTPSPVFETAPAPEPVAMPEPPAAVSEPEPELPSEPDLVLTDFEAEIIIEEPVIAAETVEPEPAQAPAWEAEPPSFAAAVEREAAYEAPRSNGHYDYSNAGSRSLEDSVKDMLRPMLRQWLDENMSRVLTSVLKDELRDNPGRFERD